jgi:hypothetical protein
MVFVYGIRQLGFIQSLLRFQNNGQKMLYPLKMNGGAAD